MLAVTGSNGFLGKKFIIFLKKKKITFIRLPKIIKKKHFNKFYFSSRPLKKFLVDKKIKYIIHFAGVRKIICDQNFSFSKKSIYYLTRNICNQIKKTGLNVKLIYISTDHVFDGKSRFYKENNIKNLKPNNNLGKLKLLTENYIKKEIKHWIIVRTSAIMDDPRLSSFVKMHLKKKKKIDLFSNVFFTPVYSGDLNKLIFKIVKLNIIKKIFHCSGQKRLSKYNFYLSLFGKNNFFIKKNIKNFSKNSRDLSLSHAKTCSDLKFSVTNFRKSINITRKILNY
jgi:dTDP-4-dehydrorhamnose reductase